MLVSQNGHTATVELLHRLGADVKAAKQARRLRAIMRAWEQWCDARCRP